MSATEGAGSGGGAGGPFDGGDAGGIGAQGTSTRPYLIRALHDWCTDNGYTPYIAVHVDDTVRVPREYVKNHEIVLNVGFEATSGLKLGNELIEFKARFGGSSRDISVPVDHVIAIYARENGQGMAFPMPSADSAAAANKPLAAASPATPTKPSLLGGGRGPKLANATRGRKGEPASGQDASSDDEPPEPPKDGGAPPKRPSLKLIK